MIHPVFFIKWKEMETIKKNKKSQYMKRINKKKAFVGDGLFQHDRYAGEAH